MQASIAESAPMSWGAQAAAFAAANAAAANAAAANAAAASNEVKAAPAAATNAAPATSNISAAVAGLATDIAADPKCARDFIARTIMAAEAARAVRGLGEVERLCVLAIEIGSTHLVDYCITLLTPATMKLSRLRKLLLVCIQHECPEILQRLLATVEKKPFTGLWAIQDAAVWARRRKEFIRILEERRMFDRGQKRVWRDLAECGHLDALHDLLTTSPAELAQSKLRYIARFASQNGDIPLLRWAVVRTEGPGTRRELICTALRAALASGHTAVAQWILSEVDIPSNVISSAAVRGGNPVSLQWAHERGCLGAAAWRVARRQPRYAAVLTWLRDNNVPGDQVPVNDINAAGLPGVEIAALAAALSRVNEEDRDRERSANGSGVNG
jgi:hypothetical protein